MVGIYFKTTRLPVRYLLYIAITFVGVRGLHWIGMASVPLFVILGIWVAYDAASTTTASAIFNYAGNNGKATMSMGVGLTVVIALFIDAGTVTSDFNRWAATPARCRCRLRGSPRSPPYGSR